jgi:hypothetical protein
MSRPRVIVLVGMGRSGSTMLERAVAGVPGVFALGELVHVWDRSVRDNELCACGRQFRDCEFWTGVGERAFGGWDQVDDDRLIAAKMAVVRTRYVARLLRGRGGSAQWRTSADELLDAQLAVIRAAHEQSGATVLVDSSKLPAYAALMARGDLDLTFVEVVRDPRGVAHSLGKTVRRPEADAVMHRNGLLKAAGWWSTFDVLARYLRRRGSVPWQTVRYEDFVKEPAATVAGLLAFGGLNQPDLGHIQGGVLLLTGNHQMAGNPVRFDTGSATIIADEAWRSEMPVKSQKTVRMLTSGLRRRHGYR